MKKKIVAGNWKMNNNLHQTADLIEALKQKLPTTQTEIIIAPSFVNLHHAVEKTKGTLIQVAAQNMHSQASGAYTGEVSADMLKSIGVDTVILGHSERRSLFGEDDNFLRDKVNTALASNFRIIFCFGEELEDRKTNKYREVVATQLRDVLFGLEASSWKQIVLAYEPVWAIGTGETASPEQAQEVHAYTRSLITEHYDASLADSVSILYGGSVNPDNARLIFSQPDVDGGLIGGASLKADNFSAIATASI